MVVAKSEITWRSTSFTSSSVDGCSHFDIISTNTWVLLADDMLEISFSHALIASHLVLWLTHLTGIVKLIGGRSG